MSWPEPLAPVLEGGIVRLEPLGEEHRDGLFEASRFPEIWRWIREYPESRADFDEFFDDAMAQRIAGLEFPFATVDASSGEVIGSTRYLEIRPDDLGVEIGWTFLTPSRWRTGANVEAKLLMLTYAFETLGCIRVELKTHASNQRSRDAMEAMGASFEGVHRKKRIQAGIGIRDTAWFSVIDDEWPQTKRQLLARLQSHAG